jgi:hypothetical protein
MKDDVNYVSFILFLLGAICAVCGNMAGAIFFGAIVIADGISIEIKNHRKDKEK